MHIVWFSHVAGPDLWKSLLPRIYYFTAIIPIESDYVYFFTQVLPEYCLISVMEFDEFILSLFKHFVLQIQITIIPLICHKICHS